ncbi:hypothetical protein BJ165DRAFT_1532574 [Panaeolus papilionaceus]|nr:hypothetical protein BJ165DRAFT_1532574 [Panaeolus papilionaceus]
MSAPDFALVRMAYSQHIRESSFGSNLYNDLQQRIQNLSLEIANLQSDLLGAAEQDDAQLTAMLILQLDSAQKLLAMFEQEMHEFGPPPANTPPVHNLISVSPRSRTLAAVSQTLDVLTDTPPVNAIQIVDSASRESGDQIQEPASSMPVLVLPATQISDPVYHQPLMVLQVNTSHAPHTPVSLPEEQIIDPISIQANPNSLRRARLTRVVDWMKGWIRKLRERLNN